MDHISCITLLHQLTVPSRSAIVVKFLVAFLCCPLVFEFSVGMGVFVMGLSQISFFFSLINRMLKTPYPSYK